MVEVVDELTTMAGEVNALAGEVGALDAPAMASTMRAIGSLVAAAQRLEVRAAAHFVRLGAFRAGKGRLVFWIPLMQLYFPMATVAAWRAMWQALRQPFHWEKTQHGVFAEGTTAVPLRPDGQGPP